MASALRCFAKAVLLRKSAEAVVVPCVVGAQVQIRNYQIKNSPQISSLNLAELPDFEVSKDPKEWEYVERLLPLKIVPKPKITEGPTPSGWVPPKVEGKTHPYFVPRNKNHMQPVYLNLSYRGSRHITVIRRIQGDIWQMEKDLRKYLQSKLINTYYKDVGIRVNEMAAQIRLRGDYVSHVKQWMDMKGF